ADRQPGQRVREGLLEAEELDDAEVDGRMEPETALVGAERGIELHAKAAGNADLPPVVHPRHAEDDLALGLADAFDERIRDVLRALGDHPSQAFQDLSDRLVKFGLAGVPPQHFGQDRLDLLVNRRQDVSSPPPRGAPHDANSRARKAASTIARRVARPALILGTALRRATLTHPSRLALRRLRRARGDADAALSSA